jgi:hypothetical protein
MDECLFRPFPKFHLLDFDAEQSKEAGINTRGKKRRVCIEEGMGQARFLTYD